MPLLAGHTDGALVLEAKAEFDMIDAEVAIGAVTDGVDVNVSP